MVKYIYSLDNKEKNLYNSLFDIDKSIKLDLDEFAVLKQLYPQILELLAEYGEDGTPQIKEIVADTLNKENYEKILEYLNLDIKDNITTDLDEIIEDPDFLKVEETESKEDFFGKMLKDETINDLVMSLKGFERKADGAKEVFIKKRKAMIPKVYIDDIQNILEAKFNKINFLSKKSDEEQAGLIIMAYTSIFDILLEIPYICCTTQTTMGILSMSAMKLSNLIGFSDGFRDKFLETVQQSLQSKRQAKEGDLGASLEY